MPNKRFVALAKISRSTKMVVSAAPTSTTNITGVLASVIGFSFTKDCLRARFTISASNRGLARASFFGSRDVKSSVAGLGGVMVGDIGLEQLSFVHQVVFHDLSERKRGKKRESADNQ